jgi:hypothetical protein
MKNEFFAWVACRNSDGYFFAGKTWQKKLEGEIFANTYDSEGEAVAEGGGGSRGVRVLVTNIKIIEIEKEMDYGEKWQEEMLQLSKETILGILKYNLLKLESITYAVHK